MLRQHCSRLHLAHNVEILVHDAKTRKLLDTIKTHNLIVTTGIQQIIDLCRGDSIAAFGYGAVGTVSTPAAPGNTALGAEVFRQPLTASNRTGSIWTITMYLSSTQANGNALREFGEFTTPAVGGAMLARIVHGLINKTTSVTVTYLHTITVTAS